MMYDVYTILLLLFWLLNWNWAWIWPIIKSCESVIETTDMMYKNPRAYHTSLNRHAYCIEKTQRLQYLHPSIHLHRLLLLCQLPLGKRRGTPWPQLNSHLKYSAMKIPSLFQQQSLSVWFMNWKDLLILLKKYTKKYAKQKDGMIKVQIS